MQTAMYHNNVHMFYSKVHCDMKGHMCIYVFVTCYSAQATRWHPLIVDLGVEL